MKLKCKDCDGPLDDSGEVYECWMCKRRIDKKTHAELLQFVKPEKPQSHGNGRIDALKANAFVENESPEFPMGDAQE